MILILDLDDTIYKTSSIKSSIFNDSLDIILAWCNQNHQSEIHAELMTDLWQQPFDFVAKKYFIPNDLQTAFYHKINTMEYSLDICPFEDYPILKNIDVRKFLVTTGFRKLQLAKIDALNISNEFEDIFIDDPSDKDRIYKKGIFEKIIQRTKSHPKNFWVIGDNPESELKAGKDLGMNTILILNNNKSNSVSFPNVDFIINSFEELENIIA